MELCGRPGCDGRIEAGSCTVCRTPASGVAGFACPACGAVAGDRDTRFCAVCWYDLAVEVGEHRPLPGSPGADPLAPAGADWEVRVVEDLSLDTEPDTGDAPPTRGGERLYAVDRPEMLLGRRDDQHGIRPEIPVFDPGVSRRHASLFRLRGGRLAILDLASANGTTVNGEELAAGQRRELRDGDTVTIGRWTRITVRRRTT